jgi:hypothetical protein
MLIITKFKILNMYVLKININILAVSYQLVTQKPCHVISLSGYSFQDVCIMLIVKENFCDINKIVYLPLFQHESLQYEQRPAHGKITI